MAIAAALGAVQGFTRNIQEEKELRMGEQTKLDNLTNLIANASLTAGDDFNAGAADIIGNMIKDAQGKIDARDRINIFGKAGPRVNVDLTSVMGTLANTAKKGSSYMIGDFNLLANNTTEFAERFAKDMSNPSKKSNLIFLGLEQYRAKVGDDKFKEIFSAGNNKNALRREYRQSLANFYKAPQEDTGTKKIYTPSKDIAGFNFMSEFLGLNSDADIQQQADLFKDAYIDQFNPFSTDYVDINKSNLSVITNFNDPDTMMAFDLSALSKVSKTTDIPNFTVEDVDFIASSQGRTRDTFMLNFSKRFQNEQEFTDALGHAVQLSKKLRGGADVDFGTIQGLVSAGEYLEKNVPDSTMQSRIVEGLIGTLLTQQQQLELALGLTEEDQFRIGPNNTEAFKKTYGQGATYAQFKERVDAARKASQQLTTYMGIVEGIPTVKDSFLDTAAKFVNSIFAGGGKIDQFVAMITGDPAGFKDGTSEATLKASAESYFNQIKTSEDYANDPGGKRAERDALAFIIAAQMARAEDSAGRLSDGDLQRNLEKLTGRGFTTKVGERKAIAIVKEEMDILLDELSGIDALVDSPEAAQGFGIDLRLKMKALSTRDRMLSEHRRNQSMQRATQQAQAQDQPIPEVSAAQILAEDSQYSIMPRYTANGGGTVYVDMTTASTDQNPFVYVLSADGTQVLHAARKNKLMTDGIISYNQQGAEANTATDVSAAEQSSTSPRSSASVNGTTFRVTDSATRQLTEDNPLGFGRPEDYVRDNTQSNTQPAPQVFTTDDLLARGLNLVTDIVGVSDTYDIVTIKGLEGQYRVTEDGMKFKYTKVQRPEG